MANCAATSEPVSSKRRKSNEHEDFQDLPMCLYGSFCYDRRPHHLQKYKHKPRKLSPREANLPPCKRGAKCLDRNLLHFALYYHPTSSNTKELVGLKEEAYSSPDLSEDQPMRTSFQQSTRPVDREERSKDENVESFISQKNVGTGDAANLEQNEAMIEKKVKLLDSDMRHDTVFKRGPSILKSYSILTEEQRKDLIKRAFEVKQVLMKRLGDTEEVLKDKTEELETLRTKLDNNCLMVDGEVEAMRQNKLVYFPLFPQRKYQEDSAAQIHFRLAESQFYRLLPAGSAYKVTKVDYVVQPSLINRFKKAREKLKENRGNEASLPVLGFHGTKEKNIEAICEEGFRVPGEQDFKHATDTGWYGKGVYFSEYPKYSMSYIVDSSKLLLCQVLPGKVFRCKHIIQGDPLRQGHDSHMSPDGKEVVIFNSHHILPSYIVHYAEAQGDFQYEQNE